MGAERHQPRDEAPKGTREGLRRVSVALSKEQLSKVRALADALGRRGVHVTRASVFRAAIDAGLDPLFDRYGVTEARQ